MRASMLSPRISRSAISGCSMRKCGRKAACTNSQPRPYTTTFCQGNGTVERGRTAGVRCAERNCRHAGQQVRARVPRQSCRPHNGLTATRYPFHADERHRGRERPFDIPKAQPQGDALVTGEDVLQVSKEKVDTAGTMTDYANKIFTLPKTALATDSRIALNQFGKYVRKYQWLGDGNAMSQYLSALLKYDFDRYFRKALFANHGQDNTPVQMSLFGEPQTVKGIRAYTEDMETWMKNGAMVVFEGQVGTLRFRKSSRYTETAVDFVPVDEGKVNTDRAADYFPIRKVYFELSGREREEQKECSELRKQLNTLYDAFIAKWGFSTTTTTRSLSCSTARYGGVHDRNAGRRDIFKADVMREPVAFKKIDTAVTLSPVEAWQAPELLRQGRYGLHGTSHEQGGRRNHRSCKGKFSTIRPMGNGSTKESSSPETSSPSRKRRFPFSRISQARRKNGPKRPQRHWRTPYPNRYPMKNSTSTWASGG